MSFNSKRRHRHYDVEPFDNCAYGEEIMIELASRMVRKVNMFNLWGSLTNATHYIWTDCALAFQQEKYPNMELMGKFVSKEDQEVVTIPLKIFLIPIRTSKVFRVQPQVRLSLPVGH